MQDDHENIPDDSDLLRRVAPAPGQQWIFDQNLGRTRPSSAVFADVDLSVDSEKVLADRGLGWQFSLRNHPNHLLVRISARFARTLKQAIFLEPAADQPDNPAHAIMRGAKADRIKRALAHSAVWVKAPNEP
jgi:hypothetical protein